jgi:thiamine-phosphate pyrophosphorylase
MKVHALVSDLDTARAAAEGGATVIQLRLKGSSTAELVERGRAFRVLCTEHAITFVVNDDLEAARLLEADGVHLGQADVLAHGARAAGLLVGISASTIDHAVFAEQVGAAYVGAGPVWETPSKPDADPPLGLDGLAAICDSVSIPVVAIGGIDETNAVDCIRAGASGVAVIRAATRTRELLEAVERASA